MIDFKAMRGFDFNALPVFLCVFKHQSILKAAQELSTTSPAITQTINKLRRYFNDPLFVRSGQAIEPTSFCVYLHQSISNEFDRLYERISLPNEKKEVIIYAPTGPLMKFISKFASSTAESSFPKIKHFSRFLNEEEIIDIFAFKKVDVVISCEPVVASGIVSEKIYSAMMPLVCRKEHPQREQLSNPDKIQEVMINERWVGSSVIYSHFDFIRTSQAFNELTTSRNVAFESDSSEIVAHFIDQSDAIGFISDPLNNTLDEAGSGKLMKLPYQSIKLDFYINYQAKQDNAHVLKVVDMFRQLSGQCR